MSKSVLKNVYLAYVLEKPVIRSVREAKFISPMEIIGPIRSDQVLTIHTICDIRHHRHKNSADKRYKNRGCDKLIVSAVQERPGTIAGILREIREGLDPRSGAVAGK